MITKCPRCDAPGMLTLEPNLEDNNWTRVCMACGYRREVVTFKREPIDWKAEGGRRGKSTERRIA